MRSESPGVDENEPLHHDIEVEIVHAPAELRRIDDAQARIDAERCQVLM